MTGRTAVTAIELVPTPTTIEATGVGRDGLLKLMLKTMYVRATDSGSALSRQLCLHVGVVNELIEMARDGDLLEPLGVSGLRSSSEMRLGLTGKGRQWAADAFEQSKYVGPTPVSLADYQAQVERQRLVGEKIGRDVIDKGLEGLIVPETLVRRLGPAVNSGRAILLYGKPGNGKTCLAEVIGRCFGDTIQIPYAIDVDGTIIKVFDPTVHERVGDRDEAGGDLFLRADDTDRRWAPCRRPVIIVGGELTLEMLDLKYDSHAKMYEAPLHLKANGGTFIIDDLGRQLVRPEDLLNRWIVPMEKRVDYLTLHTGRTFSIPFDELVVFSTNLSPEDLMDPAFLRRIPYKVEIPLPSRDQFSQVFHMVSAKAGLTLSQEMCEFVMNELVQSHGQPLSFFQPKFVVDQVAAACKYLDMPLAFEQTLVEDALNNLSARSADDTVDAEQTLARFAA